MKNALMRLWLVVCVAAGIGSLSFGALAWYSATDAADHARDRLTEEREGLRDGSLYCANSASGVVAMPNPGLVDSGTVATNVVCEAKIRLDLIAVARHERDEHFMAAAVAVVGALLALGAFRVGKWVALGK